ncbi:MAG: nuclease-related domain-containing protein [Sulfurovum sp.]|nr:nuclease-related domain-containing protein [Sulfurovum sp.]
MPLVAMPKEIEGMNKSEKFIVNKLKQLYMAEPETSYLYLEPKIKNLTPDFILIDPIRGVIIIEVKAWSIEYIDTINQKEVLSSKGDHLENPLYKARRYFNTLQGVFKAYDDLLDENNDLNIHLHSLIIFTELKKEEAKTHNIEKFFDHYPARVIYKEGFNKLSLDSLFNHEIKAIDSTLVDTLKVAIFPEIKIRQNKSKKDSFLEKNF